MARRSPHDPYTGYDRMEDIGSFQGLLGGHYGPEIANSIFSGTPTDFGNTKIKPRKCLDGSLPPCDEDVITSSDCPYGKCPDGSCKDYSGNCN